MNFKAIGDYQVYEDGTVVSVKGKKPKVLKWRYHAHGYKTVCLRIDNKEQYWLIHRLVATLFIPNPNNKPQVDHIDGNKENNNVNNLRWVTNLENRHNPNTEKNFLGHYHSKSNYTYERVIKGKTYYDDTYLKRRNTYVSLQK